MCAWFDEVDFKILGAEGKEVQKINPKRKVSPSGRSALRCRQSIGNGSQLSFLCSCADKNFSFVLGNMAHCSCKQNLFILRLCRGKKKLMAKLREGAIAAAHRQSNPEQPSNVRQRGLRWERSPHVETFVRSMDASAILLSSLKYSTLPALVSLPFKC